MMRKLKLKVMNYLLKDLCNTFVFDQVVVITRKKNPKGEEQLEMKVGERLLPETELKELISEAKVISKFRLLPIILGDMKSQACNSLVNKSESIEDMVFSKAILYAIDVLEKKVNQIAAL